MTRGISARRWRRASFSEYVILSTERTNTLGFLYRGGGFAIRTFPWATSGYALLFLACQNYIYARRVSMNRAKFPFAILACFVIKSCTETEGKNVIFERKRRPYPSGPRHRNG
jgi:hypothetical protein